MDGLKYQMYNREIACLLLGLEAGLEKASNDLLDRVSAVSGTVPMSPIRPV